MEKLRPLDTCNVCGSQDSLFIHLDTRVRHGEKKVIRAVLCSECQEFLGLSLVKEFHELVIGGWKSSGSMDLKELDNRDFLIKEPRKGKEDGSVVLRRTEVPRKNVLQFWELIKANCRMSVQYQYSQLVELIVDHYGFHEKENMERASFLEAFNGGKNRIKYYFPYFYYPAKILEHYGYVDYHGRGGLTRKVDGDFV